nr:PhoPQ-activated protein PqaA family protein [Fervidobacterium thailandense]
MFTPPVLRLTHLNYTICFSLQFDKIIVPARKKTFKKRGIVVEHTWKFWTSVAVILIFASVFSALLFGQLDLLEYVRYSGTPSYKVISSFSSLVGGRSFVLEVTSQKWRNMDWIHKVLVYIPRRLSFKSHAIVVINGSAPRDLTQSVNQFVTIAELLGAPVVSLWDVPNQPIFGLREDALIAYTFYQYYQSGEPDWPLLFPMVKSVISTMDCVQEFLQMQGLRVEKFLVTGASKRGWTAYLVGAVDPRVMAIVPIVYDNLNMPKQMRKQLEMYGKFSEQIRDYSRYSFTEMVATSEEIPDLVRAVDPYFYDIPVPKLLILGSNDPYWVVDSSEIYFADLSGPKYIRVFPNEGHDIRNVTEIVNSIRAFFLLCVGESFPTVDWKFDGEDFIVKTDSQVEFARFWYAYSESLDFRKSTWKSFEMGMEHVVQTETGEFLIRAKPNDFLIKDKNLAFFVEIGLIRDGIAFVVTTTPKVLRIK